MLSPEAFRAGPRPLAEALDVTIESLEQVMHDSFSARSLGEWGSFDETMARLTHTLGVEIDAEGVHEACRVRLAGQTELISRILQDAVPTLEKLRGMGMRIGLISDCTHELPMLWSGLPVAPLIDAKRFSIEEGMKKPDASLYVSVAKELGVEVEQCLYVGDGGSNELEGAAAVGMDAVLLDDRESGNAVVYGRFDWNGPSIAHLDQLHGLIDRNTE